MNPTQTFIFTLALLAAGVGLYIAGQDAPGALCLGAAIGVLAPTNKTKETP